MGNFTWLRQWVNRDDGRFYRINNRSVGALEAVGLLMFIAALLLWQLHVKLGIGSVWAYCSGAFGFLLAAIGTARSRS